MLLRLLLVLVPLVFLAAGCGARSSAPYTAQASVKCFTAKGFKDVTTDAAKVGFIAGFADNGGLKATAPGGNVVTIAFAADVNDAKGTEKAFRDHASPFYKRHMADIMESQRNAVLVWTTSPTQDQIQTAFGCLAS